MAKHGPDYYREMMAKGGLDRRDAEQAIQSEMLHRIAVAQERQARTLAELVRVLMEGGER